MKTIYVAGNPLIEADSLPIEMMRELQREFPDIRFLEFDPTEEFPNQSMIILDTVIGIDKVKIIEDIDKIVSEKAYSLHDFDLGYNLKLMKKMDKIRDIKIIGVPIGMEKEDALREVSNLLKSVV